MRNSNFKLLLLLLLFFSNGCALCKNAQVNRFKEIYLTTAYKNENKSDKFINIGMSSQEVSDAWGIPQYAFKLKIKNESNHYAEEFWKYTTVITPKKLDVWYEVYFQSGKVIKIREIKDIKIESLNCGGTYPGI